MRPLSVSYTPQDDNLTGFASNVTGASWPLTTTTPGDLLGHQVTIRNDSATDHSAKTALLTGTDSDGNAQTETMALPAGAATTTSTKYFKTLTTIVPSATIGADTMDIGWKDTASTPTIAVNWRALGAAAIYVDISGTISFTVQDTIEALGVPTPAQTVDFADITALAAKAADTQGSARVAATAIRVLTNSLTAGATFQLEVSQPSNA